MTPFIHHYQHRRTLRISATMKLCAVMVLAMAAVILI